MYLNTNANVQVGNLIRLTLTWDVFKYASIRQTYLDKAD